MLEKALPARYLQPTEITPKSSWLTFSNPWNQVYCSHHWITWHAVPTSCTADVADFLLYDRIVVHGSPCQLPAHLGCSFLSVAIKHKFTTSHHLQNNSFGNSYWHGWSIKGLYSEIIAALLPLMRADWRVSKTGKLMAPYSICDNLNFASWCSMVLLIWLQ